ncbi:MAG: retroviral-like aspartic protease family protein [Armatimonadota bacterium]|nr:retroviral-like aspartic protease family protein [Armatimonadota bacterium]MDW8143100.1 retroviral-like aspartic protease family protein [Armatimonadota bacterium]
MSLRVPYDTSYSPPAPVADVTLLSPTNPLLNFLAKALLDTGADITVVPDWLPLRLQLMPVGEVFVAGIDGIPNRFVLYELNLAIGQLSLQSLRVAAAPTTEFILGRDVLNQIDIRLNGPQLVLEILNY